MKIFPKTQQRVTDVVAVPIRRTTLLALGGFIIAVLALIVAVAR